MNKKISFLIALALTVLISNIFFIFSESERELESVILARVIDGDTLELEDGRIVRLVNINSPEKSSPLYIKSLNYLKIYEKENIYIEKQGIEKYGRTLARLYSQDEKYLNLELVSLGLASKFLVEESELEAFDKAEKEAVKWNKGIWKSSNYSGCLNVEVSEEEEMVRIKNICNPFNLSGWILKDESRKQYKFNILLDSEVNLHSGSGNDNRTDIFWNSKTSIWNNDRDTIYLFDSENNIVFHESYGY
ncbi:MAG: thermonuclease family protein [Nanoarchaeota archaeon]